jgi:hypothetical protein
MFDIIMNSMQVLQHELGNFKAISADVLINPDSRTLPGSNITAPKS